jgi:hypothetical protein
LLLHILSTGVSFSFTPLKQSNPSPAFLTPSKVLLANGETRMNMLSPGDATKLFHADVEYGKVVSEWRFNKDEVDIPQVRVVQGGCLQRPGGGGHAHANVTRLFHADMEQHVCYGKVVLAWRLNIGEVDDPPVCCIYQAECRRKGGGHAVA